ncbi:hypothetical protein [Pseudonocardia sp. HH130630-07]|uniref:hypothetical protein n=1 Tax=Pseudonocardia sp. HH130630-07 TaxID=1690815 RepID=UPI000814DF4D|nr:hypothetical protein [Pseudonocardia sp. HH130630-07]ANY08929.1 hypothetical protein AFB00_24690 [Pseudonocardia sp. HH130630-07]
MTPGDVDRVDDVTLGARLLHGIPTNESRDACALQLISRRAQEFGHRLADRDVPGPGTGPSHRVVERTGGLTREVPVLARFLHRSGTVELFTDSVAFCEDLVDRHGWRAWFPGGSVRAAALLHEHAHHLLAGPHARELRVAVGVPALRIGRLVRWAHVAGAAELAAHAYAERRLGLGRSPLLLTAAAADALDTALDTTVAGKGARTWAS